MLPHFLHFFIGFFPNVLPVSDATTTVDGRDSHGMTSAIGSPTGWACNRRTTIESCGTALPHQRSADSEPHARRRAHNEWYHQLVRQYFAAAVVLLVTLLLTSAVQAEPAVRCTHREDRSDLGSPVHRKKGGKSLQHRLPNGHGVLVLKRSGSWNRVQYADPGPPVRSEPLRLKGWILNRYLTDCPEPSPSTIKICWWNAKRLGHGKSRDWKATAAAVRGCDVVGLGEVMTKDAPDQLASEMGAGWKAVTSARSVGRTSYREFYTVIYDSDHVSLEDGTKGFYPDDEDDFSREPWAVTMKSGSFDFTMVLFHITWGDTAAERVAEVRQVDDAYQYFQDADPNEQDIIVVGDFNRSPWATGWEDVAELGLRTLIAGVKTTLNSEGEYASLYDQVVIHPEHAGEWTGKVGAITVSPDEALSFRKTVSDHIPVWAEFETSNDDD